MTNFRQGNFDTVTAGANLSAKQYYIVKLNSSGQAVLASAATDAIAGVLANAPVSGDSADIASIGGTGTFKVIAGGSISKDAYLTSDGNGKAVATTSSGNRVFGRARTDASTGDIVEYDRYNEKY